MKIRNDAPNYLPKWPCLFVAPPMSVLKKKTTNAAAGARLLCRIRFLFNQNQQHWCLAIARVAG